MFYYHLTDPIIACATSQSETTAVAIIRLSGFIDATFINKVFYSRKKSIKEIKPRFAYYDKLIDGDNVLDDILFLFFPAPHSFTGENVLEIHCHGNIVNVGRIIDFFVKSHRFRIAGQGEFSYRAFRNKKLSLAQVEGLGLFLNANSSFALDQGLKLLHGDLFEAFTKLQSVFLDFKSHIDMSIDFADDIGEEELKTLIRKSFYQLKDLVISFYNKSQNSSDDWISPKIVLFGPTNAGKSSLFNLLLDEQRAIVSSVRGTTRDFISESIRIDGHIFKIIDTAGIRESKDEIENAGIKRSKELSGEAFFKILVLNPADFIDDKLLKSTKFDLVVFTHNDSEGFVSSKKIILDKLGKVESLECYSGPIGPTIKSGPIGPLKNCIINKFIKSLPIDGHVLTRHRKIFSDLYIHVQELESIIMTQSDPAILSSELNIFSLKIQELIGNIDSSQVLDNIFGSFCIGK